MEHVVDELELSVQEECRRQRIVDEPVETRASRSFGGTAVERCQLPQREAPP